MKSVKGYPKPYGATIAKGKVNFAVDGKGASKCELLLYKQGESNPFKAFVMSNSPLYGNVFCVAIQGNDIFEYDYNYKLDDTVVVDPYAKGIVGRETWGKECEDKVHGIRASISTEEFNWENDKPLAIPWQDVIAYSVHVRGYTKHPSSQVKAKGTFQGLIEKIPYLCEIGINQIQCMPIYEFDECSGRNGNYWGYGPGYFFAPKAGYAIGTDAIYEMKKMIKCFHEAGIEVVLELPFSEKTHQELMLECLRYYRTEFHVDGFVLNSYHIDLNRVKEDSWLAGTKIMEKRDDFQITMRRFLKSDEDMINEVIFWLQKRSSSDGFFNYITNHTGFTLHDLVTYDGKHNEANGEQNQDGPNYNYSWNCGEEGPSRKKTVIALRKRQIKNAFLLLLTAQGTPCILSGDEFANSQKGNNNAYCQDNKIGWVDWSKYKKEIDLVSYVKELIALRKRSSFIHRKQELLGMDRNKSGIPDVSFHGESAWRIPKEVASRYLGVYYSGQKNEEDCFVAYNMHWEMHTFALPALCKGRKWYQVMSSDGGFFKEHLLLENQKNAKVTERSIGIFIGK